MRCGRDTHLADICTLWAPSSLATYIQCICLQFAKWRCFIHYAPDRGTEYSDERVWDSLGAVLDRGKVWFLRLPCFAAAGASWCVQHTNSGVHDTSVGCEGQHCVQYSTRRNVRGTMSTPDDGHYCRSTVYSQAQYRPQVRTVFKLEAIQRWSAICRVWPGTLTYQKFLLCVSSQGQEPRPILTPKIEHVHLLVLIWERLQTPTTTTMMTTTPTMPDAIVQPLGRHIANKFFSKSFGKSASPPLTQRIPLVTMECPILTPKTALFTLTINIPI